MVANLHIYPPQSINHIDDDVDGDVDGDVDDDLDDDVDGINSENIPSDLDADLDTNTTQLHTQECQIWTEKYRPKTLSEYYMPIKQLATVKKWIKSYIAKSEDSKPFLILYGTAGIGKTTLAHLILKKYKFDIIECNASDSRSKKNLQELIGQIGKVSVVVTDKAIQNCNFFTDIIKPFASEQIATDGRHKKTSNSNQQATFINNVHSQCKSANTSKINTFKKDELTLKSFKQTAIIMDEIDGLTGGESGGVHELLDIIVTQNPKTKECKSICPVICTTNSIREKKLQGVVKLGVVVNIGKPTGSDSRKLIERILKTENFTIPDEKIASIINVANGDYRQLIYLTYDEYLNRNTYLHNKTLLLDADTPTIPTTPTTPTTSTHHSLTDMSISHYDDSEDYTMAIRLATNLGDSPLDKINHFLTHDTQLCDIKYICSGDSNLFYLNIYFNVISIMNTIQHKKNETRTKEHLQIHLHQCCKIYNLLSIADALNDLIYTDKNWELLNLFEYIGLALPVKEMSNLNIKQKMPSGSYITHVPTFYIQHHTQYNYMRQEQALNDKMIISDSAKTYDIDPINIYYKLKIFEIENKAKTSKPTSLKAATRKHMSQNPYNIDKSYLKILEKIDSLLR